MLAETLQRRAARQILEDLYKSTIRKRHGAWAFARIPEGSKLEASAVRFIKLCHKLGKEPREVLEEVLSNYSSEWCMQTFKREWPPIGVLISDKSIAKIQHKINPIAIKVDKSNLNETVEKFLVILNSITKEEALECIKNGWPAGSPKVREELKRRITSGK